MKRNFILFCLLVISVANAQKVQEFQVNFENDSYELTTYETSKINTVIRSLPNLPKTYKIQVTGHTDNVGDLAYNKTLSENRAATVANYFKTKGFPESRIFSSAKAFLKPITTNANETGKSKNRRVTIVITSEFSKITNLGGFQLKEDRYKISTNSKQTITYKSGSKITIPENAFADEKGNPVTGIVDLSYIEYRNPIDFILGNIPMDFDPNDGSHFNSAGMNKILASQNGKPVFLKSDKTIAIDFPLASELPDLNFYNYDTITKKWSELAKLTPAQPSGQSIWRRFGSGDLVTDSIVVAPICDADLCVRLTQTIKIGMEWASSTDSFYQKYTTEKKIFDSIQLSLKSKKNDEYTKNNKLVINKTKKDIARYQQLLNKNRLELSKIPAQIQKSIPSYNLVKTFEKQGETTFRILFKALYNIETTDFSETFWTTGTATIDAKVFDKKWDSCIITESGENQYSVTLKDSSETKILSSLQMKNSKKDKQSLLAAMNNGITIQNKKIDDFRASEKNLSATQISYTEMLKQLKMKLGIKSDDTFNKTSLECFWQNNRNYMSPEEAALPIASWFAYFDANKILLCERYSNIPLDSECAKFQRQREDQRKVAIENQRKLQVVYDNAATTTKSLNIEKLGIFNCDQISRLQQPIVINSIYKTENGAPLKPLLIYLVDSKINGIISYNGYNGYDPNHFAYSPTSNNTLLAFDGTGDSYIIDAENFKKAVQNSEIVFQMKKIENIKNKTELQNLF